MSASNKIIQAAAGNAAGEGLYVEDVFSTYLYTGNGSTQVIENEINLGTSNFGGSIEFNRPSRLEVTASLTGTGDQTIECWGWMDDSRVTNQSLFGELSNQIYIQIYNSLVYLKYGSVYLNTSIPASVERSWVHWAIVRDGSSVKLYRDGTSILSGTLTTDPTINGTFIVGDFGTPTIPFNGYISNMRVSNTARYTANFTPSTSAFTADANTTILLCQGDNPAEDQSGNSSSVTRVGGAIDSKFGPFTSDTPGEGGLVWLKNRDAAVNHQLHDTERGVGVGLNSNNTNAEYTDANSLTAFNSNGFTVGPNNYNSHNQSGVDFASWTFRKAPKFFDVVTWTGTGSDQTISHNLGSVPGCIIIKDTSTTNNWIVWHNSIHSTVSESDVLVLNTTTANTAFGATYIETISSSSFVIKNGYSATNTSGRTYVAYLFAHNNNDGDFGETGDQDIIKCGSYTGAGSGAVDVDLGFEPQFVFIKNASRSSDWMLQDIMRGMSHGSWNPLVANKTQAELGISADRVVPTATGFTVNNNGSNDFGQSGDTVIYIAIRRGPMKTPESGTDVFAVTQGDNTSGNNFSFYPGFPVDMAFMTRTNATYDNRVGTRLTGAKQLLTHSTAAETTNSNFVFDSNEAWRVYGFSSVFYAWNFRRAPGFFDVVAYPGTTGAKTVSHNLGVTPEMMIFKNRTGVVNWIVYHKDTGSDSSVDVTELDTSDALRTSTAFFNSTQPTDSVFTVGTASHTNYNGQDYIAYLFATLPGVSKVGSYTGNGTSQTIDCGFSAGARFVLIKRTDSTSNWNVFDTERGIVAGNDPRLELNTTDAEDTGDDGVDPDSSGFAVNYVATNDDDVNVSGGTYIFLAIA